VTFSLLALALLLAAPDGRTAAGFENYLAGFRAAVLADDAKGVADRTQLPFLYRGKPRDHAGFQKIYPELFDRKVRACFKGARVVAEGDRFVVHCDRHLFYFGAVNGSYRLIEFAADPEAGP
jgi:hypothetical protein